jgi:hypothetical protein
MADRDIIIGRAINLTGMIGVMAGIVLFAFAIVMLLFRRGFGFDLSSAFRWSGSLGEVAQRVRFRANRTS